ncbi:hypothetical protein P9112_010931 [Eukaryota sp. TZLM1-RC]
MSTTNPSTTIPLARVRRIAKADPDTNNISKPALAVLSHIAVLFTETLTKESYKFCEQSNRKTLQYGDVAQACHEIDQFDFLEEVVPKTKTA